MNRRRNIRIFALIIILVVLLDQVTKALVRGHLQTGESINAIPGLFDIHLVYNEGAAFSILQNATAFFIIIAIAVVVGVFIYLLKGHPESKLFVVELSMIAAGAVGNGIDRVMNHGKVTDFIATVFMDFPIFNVADIAVTIGCIMLILTLLITMFKTPSGKSRSDMESGGEE